MFTHQLNVLTQKIFFPNTKVRPSAKWVESFSNIGPVRKLVIKRDGFEISAVEICGHPEPRGIAILGHPISKKAKYFYTENQRVKIYLENGYNVVCFDFNGFGESDRIDLRYWKDAQAAVRHLKEIYPDIPFALHGVSFGAFHVLRASADLPQNSSVILENMSRSLYDYWKRWPHTKALVSVFETLPIRAFREMEVINQFKNWSRPDLKILAFASEKDVFTPADEMIDALDNFQGTKTQVLLEGSTHLMGPVQQFDIYRDALSRNLANGMQS